MPNLKNLKNLAIADFQDNAGVLDLSKCSSLKNVKIEKTPEHIKFVLSKEQEELKNFLKEKYPQAEIVEHSLKDS